ncbi:MAG: ribulose-phosphate 3-epimerase [Anaerolineaceae bacterium]|nr:ribulose-phosphate 3-epimerase [Anaerolineaceae bacterium]
MSNNASDLVGGSGSGKGSIWQQMPVSRLLVDVSLWSADFTHFAQEIARVDPYADLYHIDVSDGHFVPGFLFFADLVAALRPLTAKPFHVHLMATNPMDHVADFVAAGADIITVHVENGPIMPAVLDTARRAGVATGMAMGLGVQPDSIAPFLGLVDTIVVMGTPIGVKGVSPSTYVYDRVRQVKSIVSNAGLQDQIKVFADGGIRDHTVPNLRAAGADGVVAGSLAFKSPDLAETFRWLHSLEVAAEPLQ